MKPQCSVSIGGGLASGLFMSRLISCEVTDKEGVSSDTVSLELADYPPAAIPDTGAIISVSMGYAGGLAFMGNFTADEIEVHAFPFKISITGKAADLRAKMKENKERHFDDKTVKDIVSKIAGEHGLAAKVDGDVGSHFYKWMGQQDESDIHFLERLANRHNALFSVKNGSLIFAKKGSGQSAGGGSMGGVIITPANLIEGTCKTRFADRAEYKEVAAYFQDKDKVERTQVKEQSSPKGSAIYRLGEPFADEKEARQAAKSKAKELQRAGITTSCDIAGNPSARAGAPMVYAGVRPGVDGIVFIIETARHKYSKSGYTTSLDGKIKV